MKMNDIGLPDVKALVAFGKIGMAIMGAKIVSLVSIVGIIALAAYVIYAPSWQGAAVVACVGLLGVLPAINAESRSKPGEKDE